MIKNSTIALFSAVSVSCLAFATPAYADGLFAPTATEEVTMSVDISAADFADSDAVNSLYARIMKKALYACSDPGEMLTRNSARRHNADCISSLVASAVGSIDAPQLTATHRSAKFQTASLDN